MSVLDELTLELNKLYWDKNCHRYKRRKTLDIAKEGEDEPERYYFIIGKIRDWSRREHNNYTASIRISKASKQKKHNKITELATKFIKEYDPDFKYTSIQFSRCMRTPIHRDRNNVGESVIVGLGDYKGGTLDIYDGDIMSSIDVHHKPYKFNGSTTYHKTGDFEGMRYTITFFNIKPFPETEHKDTSMNYNKMELADLTKQRDALLVELNDLKSSMVSAVAVKMEDVTEKIVCGDCDVDIYAKMSIKDLRDVCKDKNIRGVSKMKKKDIIAVIKASQEKC